MPGKMNQTRRQVKRCLAGPAFQARRGCCRMNGECKLRGNPNKPAEAELPTWKKVANFVRQLHAKQYCPQGNRAKIRLDTGGGAGIGSGT